MNLLSSAKMLKKYRIEFAFGKLVKNEEELLSACRKLGFPLAMKVVSEEISHKSDIGGVQVNIRSEHEAAKNFYLILRNAHKHAPRAKIEGIYVQKFLEGKQLIIGGKLDEQFGPTIIFGLGGIFVEIMKDVSLRICPIDRIEAKKMIAEIKGFPLLKGVRGEHSINFKKLEAMLLKVNTLMMREKLKELDLNPVIANEREVIAVDARVIK